MHEVTAGHALESHEPRLVAAVPGIHVLGVDGNPKALTSADIDGLMGDAGVAREPCIRFCPIAGKKHVIFQYRQQAGA